MRLLGPCLTAFLSICAVAQNATFPEAPTAKETSYIQHSFFDVVNDSGIALSAIGIIGDSLSTQRFLSTGLVTEGNPIAQPFVKSRGGQAFISAAGFGGEVGGMYLFHRLERHAGRQHRVARIIYGMMERSTPMVVSIVEFDRWHRNNVLAGEAKRICSEPGVACH